MIRKTTAALLAMLALASCGGDGTNPFDDDTTTDDDVTDEETINGIPAGLASNLTNAVYDPDSGTLSLTLEGFDATPIVASFVRNAALDVDGYQAYTLQDDPLDRHFTALTRRSTDPGTTVKAGVVGDGGQFNYFYSGGYYERSGSYSPPSSGGTPAGLVSYAGSYVGVTNMNVNSASPNNDLQAIADPTIPTLNRPQQARRVTGDIFLNVSFGDNAVNGGISNRNIVDGDPTVNGGLLAVPDIVLVQGVIDGTAGTFAGSVEHAGETGTSIGAFGGIFGGTDATAVGGVVEVEQIDINDGLGLENEFERGVFVLDRCGTANDDPICDTVN
ncbi:thymidylate synthase [Pseudooceanicola sp.]|uniref:thymidylate synthase n=1 Tax=Pseudooceanicola sp. TaxID=1914328 RepID=UPI0035C6BAB9